MPDAPNATAPARWRKSRRVELTGRRRTERRRSARCGRMRQGEAASERAHDLELVCVAVVQRDRTEIDAELAAHRRRGMDRAREAVSPVYREGDDEPRRLTRFHRLRCYAADLEIVADLAGVANDEVDVRDIVHAQLAEDDASVKELHVDGD